MNLQEVISVSDLEADASHNKLTRSYRMMERSKCCASSPLKKKKCCRGVRHSGILRNLFPLWYCRVWPLGWIITLRKQTFTPFVYTGVLLSVNRTHLESHKVANVWKTTSTTTTTTNQPTNQPTSKKKNPKNRKPHNRKKTMK